MSNLAARINRLEKAEGVREARIRSVHFVETPEEARPGDAHVVLNTESVSLLSPQMGQLVTFYSHSKGHREK